MSKVKRTGMTAFDNGNLLHHMVTMQFCGKDPKGTLWWFGGGQQNRIFFSIKG